GRKKRGDERRRQGRRGLVTGNIHARGDLWEATPDFESLFSPANRRRASPVRQYPAGYRRRDRFPILRRRRKSSVPWKVSSTAPSPPCRSNSSPVIPSSSGHG